MKSFELTGEVRKHVPTVGVVLLHEEIALLTQAPATRPFDSSRMDFVADLALRLGRNNHGIPEIQALSFWMRKTELARLKMSFQKLEEPNIIRQPRGVVFHVPPGNVDTLFIYSWILSALAGNRNIVRLPSRETDISRRIVDTLNQTLEQHPKIAETVSMVSYGHERSATELISASCDVRVIWGGDQTIREVRSIPLPPHATELTFSDRQSLAAISTEAYQKASDAERHNLCERFYNDTFVFDQMGCSSPRLLLWIGDEDAGPLQSEFYSRLATYGQSRKYLVDDAASIAKMSQSFRAMIDTKVTSYRVYSPVLTILEVEDFPKSLQDFVGGGILYQLRTKDLLEVLPFVSRGNQTLSVFGFSEDAIRDFVKALRGRGVDRVVPIGSALSFDRYWDGYDLLSELTRSVSINVSS